MGWLLLFVGLIGHSEDAKPTASRQEYWIPTEHLEQVLKDHPNAVMLSPEQYEALIRDASKVKPQSDTEKPPVALVVERLQLKGKLEPNAEQVRLKGELILYSTSPAWSELSLSWALPLTSLHAEGVVLAALSAEESGKSLGVPWMKPPRTLSLHVKGTGRHVLHFETIVPVSQQIISGWRSLNIYAPSVSGWLDLEVADGLKLINSSPFQSTGQGIRMGFNHRNNIRAAVLGGTSKPNESEMIAISIACEVRWVEAGVVLPDDPLRFRDSAQVKARVNETEVTSELSVHLFGESTPLEIQALQLPLSPNTEVTSVSGFQLLNWQQREDTLLITLPGNAAPSSLSIHLRSPRDAAQSEVVLPHIRLPLALRADVNLELSEGLELLALEGKHSPLKPTGLLFSAPLSELPVLKVRSTQPRLEVDADTLVRLDKDSVNLQRTLNLRTDKPVHELRITLPESEEFIRVESVHKDFEWKRVERVIEMRFPSGVRMNEGASVSLHTRQKLIKAWSGPRVPEQVTVKSLIIPEAVKVAGYSALDFDDSWRVGLKEASGLEDRDARLSPVKGRMAWFGLRDWSLAFEVERAEPVYAAEVIAYALPRARTVEIEGQFVLDISGAPLRTFEVRLTQAQAKFLRVTSPLVGEQQLDETTGAWTYTLRQESKGRQVIRFRLSLPAEVVAKAQADPSTELATRDVRAVLPRIELRNARRFQGTWIIEANTDTQLSFEAQSLQPLDVLKVPTVEGYAPRHRLAAAYTYGVGEHGLTLNARRHEHSEMATLVVREFKMTSTVGEDGTALHEAILRVQHSGEQFIALQLPEGAELLSAFSDGLPVKPLRSAVGSLAIPLATGSANQPSTQVRVQYRLLGQGLASRGKLELDPVRVMGAVPVLQTEWRVMVPPGYAYPAVETSLQQQTQETPKILFDLLSALASAGGAVTLSEADSSRQIEFLPGGPATVDQVGDRADEEADGTNSAILHKLQTIILPEFTLSNATLEEAVEKLVVLHRQFDPEPDPSRKGMNITLKSDGHGVSGGIALDLKNVPMIEALRYVTELAGMKYKVGPVGVVIVPVSETTSEQHSRTYKVSPDFLSVADLNLPAAAADPFESGLSTSMAEIGKRITPMEVLKNHGIAFPEGSSATFNPETSELTVRNTQPNLDMIEVMVDEWSDAPRERSTAGLLERRDSKDKPLGKSGLISLDFTLPANGQELYFHGAQAPQTLELNYTSWERQLVFAMLAMLAGMGAFMRWGRCCPGRSSLLVITVLTFGLPMILGSGGLALVNALLAGWLMALAGWVILKIVERLSEALKQEVPA